MTLTQLIAKHHSLDVVFVIAGGPSIQLLDLSGLSADKHAIIVCNTAFRLYPDAMLAHHADAKWWQAFGDEVLDSFTGDLITGTGIGISPFSYPKPVQHISLNNKTLDFGNCSQVSGYNSGQNGLHLAHLFAPKTIVLLGFDHTRLPNGQSHWQGANPLTDNDRMDKLWQTSMKWFTWFEKHRKQAWQNHISTQGVSKKPLPSIINASPISAIKLYPKVDDVAAYF